MASRDRHNLRATLAVRGFRRLIGVRFSSQFADGMFQAALAGSVLFNPDRQTSPLAIALGSAILVLPYSLLGPYVGVLLDRWSRRTVIVSANLIRALLVLPAALLTGAGEQGPLFVTIALIIIGLNRFFLSGLSAATPHVVADRRLVTANALSGTVGSIAYSIGLGCALLLLQTVLSAGFHAYAVVAVFAPIGYALSALIAYRGFAVDDLGPDHVTRQHHGAVSSLFEVGRGMMDGIRHLTARRGAAYAMAAQTAFRSMFGILTLAMLLLYRNYFTTDNNIESSIAALTFVFTAGAAGVFVAALLTPPITRRIGGWRWIVIVLGVTGVVLLGFGLPFRAPLLVVVVFFINIAAQSVKIVVDTAVQHECDDAYRGRVFSVNDTTFNLAYVVGMFAAALTVPDDGHAPLMLVIVSIGHVVVASGYFVAARRWVRQAGDDIAQPEPDPQPPAPAGDRPRTAVGTGRHARGETF